MFGRWVAMVLLSAWPGAVALAEPDCPPAARGPLETTPISGSSGVSTNSPIRARYPAGHLDLYEERIELVDELEVPVAGELVEEGDALFFVPEAALEPGRWYEARATGVDHEIRAAFRTGSTPDLEPPSAPVIVDADAGDAAATCAQPDGGVRLSFTFETSTDDGPTASLQYALYRTRGPDLSAPTVVARIPQEVAPGESQSLGAVLSEREAAGASCFAIVAEDGLFRTATSEELCFEPGVGVIFDSLCSVSGARAAARGLAPTALVVALLSLRLWRRRRTLLR